MARTPQLSPFARVIAPNALRATESKFTISVPGQPPRQAAEIISFNDTTDDNLIPVPISGQSGDIAQKHVGTTRSATLTGYEGLDGGYWRRLMKAFRAGRAELFTITELVEDKTSPAIGRAIYLYLGCRVTGYSRSGTAADGLKTFTVQLLFDDEEIVEDYNDIQGVL